MGLGASAEETGRPYFDLTGLVAVVTGGNRGIGLGIARCLGQAGATVSIWARDDERSQEAADELRAEGVTVAVTHCDVADEASVVSATERTLAELGRIDAAVANAGGGSMHSAFLETSLDNWDRTVRINLTGAFLTFRETAKAMVAGGRGGALVAVSSCAAVHASPNMHHYAAAKAGLGGLVRSAATELAPYGIRCNVLMPGWTQNSKMAQDSVPPELAVETLASIPAGRWGTPEDLGRAAVFLCDPSFPYHTGTELRVEGGYSVKAPYIAVRKSRELLAGGEGSA